MPPNPRPPPQLQRPPLPPQAPELPPDPQFGYAVSEWRPSFKQRTVVGVIIIVLGGALGVAGISSDDWIWVAAAYLALSVALLATFVEQGMVRVIVYTHGIERFGLTGKKRLAWDQLQSYTLNIIDPAQTAAGGGALAVLLVRLLTKNNQKPASVVLLGKDGTKVTLGNGLRGYDALIESLVPYLTDRLLAAAHADLRRGVPVSFGSRLLFDPAGNLTYTGLFKKQYVLPFANIATVDIRRAALVIVKRDTGKAWKSIRVRTVPNVRVLQRLVAR